MFNVRSFTVLVITIFVAAASRLVPHPPNFVPVFALALFGGAYFPSRVAAFVVPLGAMFLSDLILGHYVYSQDVFLVMPYVYSCFILTVCLGLWLRRSCTPVRIGFAALTSTVLFFLISNYGFWQTGLVYPKTLEGLFACYAAAVKNQFVWNALAANMIFSALLFGGFALAQRYIASLRAEPLPLPVQG
jgi:hypothetical protein